VTTAERIVDHVTHCFSSQNGDLNWIVKDRIIAFAGPHYRRNVSPEGYCTLTPAHYIPYFKEHKVDLVVRLNKKCYDEQDFVNAGIRHFEQYYLDGSCPPIKTLDSILEAFESVPSDKAFAVHCKAGLGRTGTCIGAFLMKHYKFSAAEAIGWMRICRPGMVIGPQQHFLQDLEQRMWHEGSVMNLRPTQDVMLLRITESNRSKEQEKSPKSVAAIPFVESAASDEAVIGIDESQADGLLARRNQARIT
jgi:cell division cycle 14